MILAWFAGVKVTDKVIDIGSGSGVLSVLLAKFKNIKSVTSVELQPEMYECLAKTVELNGLDNIISHVNGDIREYVPEGHYNFAICNPPYRRMDTGRTSRNGVKRNACFDDKLSIEDILTFCKKYVYSGGRLALTGDADRLVDVLLSCRNYNFEPKRLTFLYPSTNKRPKVFFLECINGAGVELIVEPPVIQDCENLYTYILQGKWI